MGRLDHGGQSSVQSRSRAVANIMGMAYRPPDHRSSAGAHGHWDGEGEDGTVVTSPVDPPPSWLVAKPMFGRPARAAYPRSALVSAVPVMVVRVADPDVRAVLA